jgi:hypothetical protein
MKTLIAWLLLAVPCLGQITVPATTEVGHLIVAKLDIKYLPDGAVLKGDVFPDVPGAEWGPGPDKFTFYLAGPARAEPYPIEILGMWGVPHPEVAGAWIDFGFFRYKDEWGVTGPIVPDPDPDPDPDPEESPIAADGLRVLIVRESSQALNQKQQAILTSTDWMALVGKNNFRVLDPQTEFLKPSIWRDAMEATAGQGVPRLIISNRPHGGIVIPLPADPEAMLTKVKEWVR